MKTCSKCGKEISEEAKFCPNCGTRTVLAPVAPEKSAAPVGQAENAGNKKVLIMAVAAVIITAIGVFLACGGWNYLFGSPQQTADTTAEGTMQQPGTDLGTQTPENIGQPPGDTAQVPGATGPGAAGLDQPSPVQPGPAVPKKKPVQESFLALQGHWEGTWNAGFGSSGSCTATIKQAGFTSVCYDSRFAGRIIMDRRGNYQFEGGNSTWSCRLGYDRRRTVLRCSYTFKSGPTSGSGSLSLYKEYQQKGRY